MSPWPWWQGSITQSRETRGLPPSCHQGTYTPGTSCTEEGAPSRESEEERERSAAEPRFQQKENTGKQARGRGGPLPGYDRGDGAGSPRDGLAFAAVKISILRIIDVYSHHLSCHLNRQLNNSQFYFPALVFRRSVNLIHACFPSFYIRIRFLIWAFPLHCGGGSFYISNNIFFYSGKIRIMYNLPFYPFLSVRFCGFKYGHLVQPSSPSHSRAFSSSQTKPLFPLSDIFPCSPPPALDNHHSTFCFHGF